jgi:hypothetical protein
MALGLLVTVCGRARSAVWLDLAVSDLESLSREELIVLARRQDAQITTLAMQLATLMEKFEQQAAELARVQHLLSRNSANSSMPFVEGRRPGPDPAAQGAPREAVGAGEGQGEGRTGDCAALARGGRAR